MRPILFHWRGVRIYSYPALLYLGVVWGTVAGNYAAKLAGLDPTRVFVAMMLLIIAGLVGSRLLFVAIHWRLYRREPRRIWRRREGGGELQGGFILSLAVSVPLLRAAGVPFAEFWDAATFTMLVGLILGRVGCVLHGCCSGRPTEGRFALYARNQQGVGRRRIPIQFLEASFVALLLIGDAYFWRGRPFPGAVFLGTVAAYQLWRFALEPAREISDWIGTVNIQRALSAGIGVFAAIGFLVAWLNVS